MTINVKFNSKLEINKSFAAVVWERRLLHFTAAAADTTEVWLMMLCVSLWAGSVSHHHGLWGAEGEDGRCYRGSESVAQPAGGEVPAEQAVHHWQQNLSGWSSCYSWDHAGNTVTISTTTIEL